MGIRSSTLFSFNNIDSSTYNIINVNIQSGLYSEPFIAPRSILEVQPRGVDVPYFQGIQKQPIEFDLTFYFEEGWADDGTIREVARWLTSPSYYTPLTFSSNPDIKFFALCTNDPQIVHNGSEGYITVHMKTNAPYAYSSFITVTKDLTTNPSGTSFTVTNNGDITIMPILQFTKVTTGDITVSNNSNGGEAISFSSVPDGVVIEIDMNTENITADDGNNYYNNWNGNVIHLLRGKNTINVTGTAQVSVKYQELVENIFL